MRISTNFKLTPGLWNLADTFEKEGYEFYFVGGFVRDTIMQSSCWDVDATTNAQPEAIKTILRSHLGEHIDALYTVGEKYGTIGVRLSSVDVEITTYRTDEYTEGSRHPEVKFGHSLYEDLARRDFTINAIACDKDANIVDPFGGINDIRDEVVRFVGNPPDRIGEDPLRMLRLVRFASKFGFGIENRERFCTQIDSHLLETVSKERIRDELCKMLLQEKPSDAVRLLKDLWLLRFITKEVVRLEATEQISPHHYENAFDHTMRVLDESTPLLEQRLTALLHDTGKFHTVDYINHEEKGEITTFYGHEEESAKITHRVLSRLRFPSETVNRVTHLVACHMRPLSLYNELDKGKLPSKRAVRRFIHKCYLDSECNVYDVMIFNAADMRGHANPVMQNWIVLQDLISREREDTTNLPEKAMSPLDGNELMELFPDAPGPGPWIGATKAHLTEKVLDGIIDVEDKDGAKREALDYWNQRK